MNNIYESRWRVLDIYYKEADQEKVDKIVEDYIAKGWEKNSDDSTGGFKGYDYCVQLLKWQKPKTIKI